MKDLIYTKKSRINIQKQKNLHANIFYNCIKVFKKKNFSPARTLIILYYSKCPKLEIVFVCICQSVPLMDIIVLEIKILTAGVRASLTVVTGL